MSAWIADDLRVAIALNDSATSLQAIAYTALPGALNDAGERLTSALQNATTTASEIRAASDKIAASVHQLTATVRALEEAVAHSLRPSGPTSH